MEAIGNSIQGITSTLAFKRLVLCSTVFVAYIDIGLDSANAGELYENGKLVWGLGMLTLLFVPNVLTWAFLRANAAALMRDLVIVVFQFGPAVGLCKSWTDGNASAELVWYNASEGLMEAPFTGLFTAYILTLDNKEASWTFYASVLVSFMSTSRTAVSLNFLGQAPSIRQKVVEFMDRLFFITFRIGSLAIFGYLMKESGSSDTAHDKQNTTQTALPMYLLSCFITNVCVIKVAEPRCPMSVGFFFGVILVFVKPLRFIGAFEKIYLPILTIRYMESLFIMVVATSPLKPNPRIWDLMQQTPYLVYMVLAALAGQMLFGMFSMLAHTCQGQQDYKPLLGADESLARRAEKIQDQFREIIQSGDALLTCIFCNLEAPDLTDALTIYYARKHLSKPAYKFLRGQGMPPIATAEEMKKANLNTKKLRDIGFTTKELKECKFTVEELTEGGCTAKELKEEDFTAATLLRCGFAREELENAGFTAEEMQEQYAIAQGIALDIAIIGTSSGTQNGAYVIGEVGNFIQWFLDLGRDDFYVTSEFKPEKFGGTALCFVFWVGSIAMHVGLDGHSKYFYEGGDWGETATGLGLSTMKVNEVQILMLVRQDGVLTVSLDGQVIPGMERLDLPQSITAVGWRPWRNIIHVKSLYARKQAKIIKAW